MLEERGVEFDTIEYLKEPLDRTTLESILHLLDGPAADLIRRDTTFEELDVDPARLLDTRSVVDLLLEYPTLMQRPIGVRGGRAIIARPADLILDLLDT